MAPLPTPQIVLLPEHPNPLPRKIKSWDQYGKLAGDTELFLLWLENKDVIYASLVADDDDAMQRTLEDMLPRRAQPISLTARQMIATDDAAADDPATEEEEEGVGAADLPTPPEPEAPMPEADEDDDPLAEAGEGGEEEEGGGGGGVPGGDEPDEPTIPPPPSPRSSIRMTAAGS